MTEARISNFRYPAIYRGPYTNFVIPGSTSTTAYLACWNGHQFEVLSPNYTNKYYHTVFDIERYPREAVMQLHYPIDPRITVADVDGATRAYTNKAGTHWLFSHCSNAWHFDKEIELVAIVESIFQEQVEERLYDCLLYANDSTRKNSALSKYNTIKSFRDATQKHVRKDIKQVHLGWFHQNPDSSHTSTRIKAALDKAYKQFQLAGQGGVVSRDYQLISAKLTTDHVPETRWQQVARLMAEQEAQEQEGT